jgi:hypothetical protein
MVGAPDKSLMKTLIEINQEGLNNWGANRRHFTDKGVSGIHNYIGFYNEQFAPYQTNANILEIGTSCGGSLWMYKQYFEQYKITGIDTISGWPDGPLPYSPDLESDPNISLYWNTSSHSPAFWNSIENSSLDIIIDDGDHSLEGQIKTFDLGWPKLKNTGVYCIEDVTNGSHKDNLVSRLKNKKLSISVEIFYGNSGGGNDDIIVWIKHI